MERNEIYNLEVTGQQLAWLFFVTNRSCNEYGLNDTLSEQYSPEFFKDAPNSKTNSIGWDGVYREEVNAWLNLLFKEPETEDQKNLRELKEQYKLLGEKINQMESK